MIKKFAEQPFGEFVEDLNSDLSAPGGGTAAGFCGAMASALAGMVAHMTVDKPRFADVKADMEEVLEKSAAFQKEMLLMAQQDAEVFGQVLNTYKLPKSTPEEEQKRNEAIEKATKLSILASLHMAEVCVQILLLAQTVVKKGSRMLVTDGAASALLARAGLRIAAYNVQINQDFVKDRSFNTKVGADLNKHVHHGAILESAIIREVESRILKN